MLKACDVKSIKFDIQFPIEFLVGSQTNVADHFDKYANSSQTDMPTHSKQIRPLIPNRYAYSSQAHMPIHPTQV